MQDEKIVALYWERDESAIQATEEKYGAYLMKIAYNILADLEDSKESVNDAYLGAWNSMPPNKPSVLSTYCHIPGLYFFQQRLQFANQPVESGGIAGYRESPIFTEQPDKGRPQRCECVLKGREQAEDKQDLFRLAISGA